ncbi:hypothetical protein ID866_9631 [Astraeus odoratus]|nr:hypothetical protein ID866_9631 [Astraeus odoratus]
MADPDFDQATLLRKESDHYQPGDPKRSTVLINLARALHQRFKDNKVLSDLDEAIDAVREAVRICPSEHPTRSLALHELAFHLHTRHDSRSSVADLEEAIALNREVLELHKPGYPHRDISLYNLAQDLWGKFKLDNDIEVLEQAITYNEGALELRKPGHPHRPITLCNQGTYLQGKFMLAGDVEVLEQAITYIREALELCPKGHRYRPLCLSNLATALRSRYDVKGSTADLEEAIALRRENLELHPSGHRDRIKYLKDLDGAISLYREALGLCSPGHPSRMTYINEMSSCLRAKPTKQVITQGGQPVSDNYPSGVDPQYPEVHGGHEQKSGASINVPYLQTVILPEEMRRNIPSHVMEIIRDVIYDTLSTMPPRLLDTHTGRICDKTVHKSRVESSPEYQALLLSIACYGSTQDTTHIRTMVSNHFQCKFATLSHRWGTDEPILADIRGHDIFRMPETEGLRKLRKFCEIAAKNGCTWGWSDTCCIDKTNGVEVQQAIGSMFRWYRNSAMTIVHLRDIPSAAPAGALVHSSWFKRGWTLQELLAPRRMQFYTQDWSLYLDRESPNHKEDSILLSELEHATGIPAQFLTSFQPGTQDVRSRLEWASTRRTKEPEDIAYSLLGIFKISMYVQYGEGAEQALGRLLGKIMSQSGDVSILEWVGEASSFHSCFPASITSYKHPLHIPSNDAEQPTISLIWKPCVSRALRKLHDVLATVPRARFSDPRLTVPCIVHRVKAITANPALATNEQYVYTIQALGLQPTEIKSSERLMAGSGSTSVSYVLVRIYYPGILENPPNGDGVDPTWRLMSKLAKPFTALLLERLFQNEYKRVASSCHIVACIDASPKNITRCTVKVLDIV